MEDSPSYPVTITDDTIRFTQLKLRFFGGTLVGGNAQNGSKPVGENSTDAQGRIRQPCKSPEPSGGFTHVVIGPDPSVITAKARFWFYDEDGRLPCSGTRNRSVG